MTGSQTQQLYTHAAQPRAVQQRKAKYREDEEQQQQQQQATQSGQGQGQQQVLLNPANIMFDRRVVRGSTYRPIIPQQMPNLTASSKSNTQKRTQTLRSTGSTGRSSLRTPEPVPGRRHAELQTEQYLEELADVVPEADGATQTDAFLDRPSTPLFVPPMTGTDAATQIENGELFDFDLEVEPILEVLVGRVLEQGLMEVMEEEELAAMKEHQQQLQAIRDAELVATQRMEAAEKRKVAEKDARLKQEKERLERERVVRAKVAASTFARGYLDGVVSGVFGQLQRRGFFYDPVEREVQEQLLPWLRQQAQDQLAAGVIARRVVDQLVRDAVGRMSQSERDRAERLAAQLAAAEEAAAREAEAAAAANQAELTSVRGRATFILRELQPPVVDAGLAEEVEKELKERAGGDAEAAFEAAKQTAAENATAEAEAALAAQREQYEAAVAAAEEAGEDAPAEPEPAANVEQAVEAAVAAVVRPTVTDITDGDVLSALLERGSVSREALVQALALFSLQQAQPGSSSEEQGADQETEGQLEASG